MERYWEVRWDCAEPYRQKIVPSPNVATITDRVVPATEVIGPDLPTTLDVPTVEAFLLRHLPDDDPRVRQAVSASGPSG